MKNLRPSARANRRYLLMKGKKEDIEKNILDYIGILGWAKAAPEFIRGEIGDILAINRESLANIRAAFEISKADIKIIKVSGTLKGLR